MAAPIFCDVCEENIAGMMLSLNGTGEVTALCASCLFPFAYQVTMGMPGGPELIAALTAPQDPPKPRSRGRKGAQAPDIPPEASEPPDGQSGADPGVEEAEEASDGD